MNRAFTFRDPEAKNICVCVFVCVCIYLYGCSPFNSCQPPTTHCTFTLFYAQSQFQYSHCFQLHRPLIYTHAVPPSTNLKHTLPLRIHMCFLAAAAALCAVGLLVCVSVHDSLCLCVCVCGTADRALNHSEQHVATGM